MTPPSPRPLLAILLTCVSGTSFAANSATVTATLSPTGACTVRPTAAATALYNAMTAARATGGLSNAELLDHAARRLGYGLSPHGTLRPASANDCSTVFLAEVITEQIAALGTRVDTTELNWVRQGVAPLSTYRRTIINAKTQELLLDPRGIELNASAVLNVESRMQVMRLSLLRELIGSQRVTGGVLFDEQINFERVWHELWLNHFNVELSKANQFYYGSDGYSESLRANIGGTFQQLLFAAMSHPAMQHYLDQNLAGCVPVSGPASNQNFARELLELFTLGVGPTAGVYSQTDVEATARVFCGWNARPFRIALAVGDSGFYFDSTKAATGSVTVLGVAYSSTGKARADAVLAALGRHASTKTSLCTKLSTRFYASPLRTAARDACVTAWSSTGDLKVLARALVQTTAFWSRGNYRTLTRNPMEHVSAVSRGAGINLIDAHAAVVAEGLTATPFNPPSLTPDLLVARVTTLQASGAFDSIRRHGAQADVMGLPRGRIVPPTGYPLVGEPFFSPPVIDEASRTPYIIAASLERMAAPARRDLFSVARDADVEARLQTTTPSAVLDWFVTDALGNGAVPLHTPSQRAIAVEVLADDSRWAVQSPAFTKRAAATLGAITLGTNAIWER